MPLKTKRNKISSHPPYATKSRIINCVSTQIFLLEKHEAEKHPFYSSKRLSALQSPKCRLSFIIAYPPLAIFSGTRSQDGAVAVQTGQRYLSLNIRPLNVQAYKININFHPQSCRFRSEIRTKPSDREHFHCLYSKHNDKFLPSDYIVHVGNGKATVPEDL